MKEQFRYKTFGKKGGEKEMPYDAEKDELLKSWEQDKSRGSIFLGVYQYDGGQKKLSILRHDEKYSTPEIKIKRKAGRLTLDEVEFILSKGKEIKTALK